MRVGIIALLQESNTFINGRTTLAHFEEDLLADGEAVREHMAGSHHEVGGFFAGLAEAGLTAIPIFAARALPFGVVEADAFTALMQRMDAALDRAGPLDGLLVAPTERQSARRISMRMATGSAGFDSAFLGRFRSSARWTSMRICRRPWSPLAMR